MEGHPEELISSYIDNELAAADRLWVEEHLRGCSRCWELTADLSAVKDRVRAAYNGVEVPETLEKKVLSAMHQKISRLTAATLFLFMLSLAGLGFLIAVAIGPVSSVFGIVLHLLRVGQLVVTADPNMTGGLMLSAVFLLLATVWSLKYLLAMEETG